MEINLNIGILQSKGYKDTTAEKGNIKIKGNLTVTNATVSNFTGGVYYSGVEQQIGSFEYRRGSLIHDPMMPGTDIMRIEINNPDYFANQAEASELLTGAIGQIDTNNMSNFEL